MRDLAALIRERLAKRPTVFPGMSSGMREHYRGRFDQMADALLAVVDRHGHYDFPADKDDGPGDYAWTPHCAYCWKPWPCPDLADVAKALGIEVEHA